MTYRIAKALHLLGLAMFLGSILGHITVGFVPGAREQAEAMLFGRRAIEIATWSLTVPGLVLLAVTGTFMAIRGKVGVLKRRWLTVHAIAGLLIIMNAALILVPTGVSLLSLASGMAAGAGSAEAFAALRLRESTFGAINLTLALLTIFIATLKPALGQSRS